MDYILYNRMQNYSIKPVKNEKNYISKVPCDVDPFCVVTIKALMLDYPNLYILSPLASVIDHILGISSTWSWITPNMISAFHVLIALLAGHCVASNSLSDRRLGVILFEFRTWLDDLDGHVARRRKHIIGEHSDVGSAGYWIDGLCDALGCVALMTGIFFFLKRNPPRRGYEKLRRIYPCIESQDANTEIIYKRLRFRALIRNILLLTGHLMITSIGWNRYIALYQDLLETNDNSLAITMSELYARQSEIMRSGFFWIVTVTWRLINFHTALDYLLMAIFFDRLWDYMKILRWFGYIIPLIVVYLTEFHFLESYAYILRGSSGFAKWPSTSIQNGTTLFNI
ncbi:PREDICTED: ceramide phosphoethanolamine synthase [Ceratosolen solmsi marchali]|uniref:Ceramide phosphoethanolamine synthase n=1 Tax=Ceratosolen solmsi marchali TaxID=326594 RepID=A0AAJ6YRQ8_9HYME|nr:PREDICTED: ceramide phosphoethanolamine synthase [Ceratosolen solmsi marchali]